jgi:hypothetical protein
MKKKIKEMIHILEKDKKKLEEQRDEKILVYFQNIELFNENWTPNSMEMIFYHIEIAKCIAKLSILNELLNEEK